MIVNFVLKDYRKEKDSNYQMEDNNISKKNKAGKRKRTRLGGYSFLVCIIAAAIVIIINMIVGSFPSTVTKLDISDEGLYTISEETEKIVSAVNEDITDLLP